MSANDDKRIESIALIETYGHGTSRDLVCKKEETQGNNKIKQHKNEQFWWCYKREYKMT